MSKIPKNYHFTKFQNHPQPLHTAITLTILTNKTIPNRPTYFSSTLTISTSHTINVLLLHFWQISSFLTSKLQRLFQYLAPIINFKNMQRILCHLQNISSFYHHTTYSKKKTHATLKCKAMWLTSQAKIKRQTDYLYTVHVLSLTCSPSQKMLVFVITFFTILRATWLLNPSQVEKYPFVNNNYYPTSTSTPTPTPTPSYPLSSPLSSTMTCTSRKEIKKSSSADSLASKHNKMLQKKGGNTISSSSPSTKKVIIGAALSKTIPIFHPPPNYWIQHLFHCQTMLLSIRKL